MDYEEKVYSVLKQALIKNQISGVYGQDVFDSYQNHRTKRQDAYNRFYFLKTQEKISVEGVNFLTKEMRKIFTDYSIQVGENFDGFFHYLIYYVTDDLTDAYIFGYFDRSHLMFGLKKENNLWSAIDDDLYATKLDYFENDHKFIPFYRRLIDVQIRTLFSLLRETEDKLFVSDQRYAVDYADPMVQSDFKKSSCVKFACFYYDSNANLSFELNGKDWGILFDSCCYIPLFDLKHSNAVNDLEAELPINVKKVALSDLGKVDSTLVNKLSEMIQ